MWLNTPNNVREKLLYSWLPVAGTAAAAGEHAPLVLDPLTLNPSLWREGYVLPYIVLDYTSSQQTNQYLT